MRGRPFGYKHTEETKRKIGDAHIGLKWSDETKKKISDKAKGRKYSEETRKLWSEQRKGNQYNVGKHLPDEVKEKLRQAMLGRYVSEETKEKHRKPWRDKEWANRQIKILRAAVRTKPNLPERIVADLLNTEYPSEWKFVGDGQVVIERLIPDFINVNGKKMIIEVFGDYWHTKVGTNRHTTEESRREVFERYGYKLLVLWEKDIKKNLPKVKNDIAVFLGV